MIFNIIPDLDQEFEETLFCLIEKINPTIAKTNAGTKVERRVPKLIIPRITPAIPELFVEPATSFTMHFTGK